MTLKYKIKKRDIKGKLKGFPKYVVKAMLKEQYRQNRSIDIKIFQDKPNASKILGGFNWDKAKMSGEKWADVIFNKNFEHLAPKGKHEHNMRIANIVNHLEHIK